MSIKIGDSYTHQFFFTQSDVDGFAEISGDNNPIHIDPDFAKKTIFKRPIIHGFLGGSVISMVLGTKFPGIGTIYLKQEMKFIRPMFVDESYECKVVVTDLDGEKKRIALETTILNAKSEHMLVGAALVQNGSCFNK